MKDKSVILVVDDEPKNTELLEAHLVPQGYEVVKAANGEEALKIYFGNQIDLVLLDVIMPGMSGIEVLEKIRADKTLRFIPVVMITVLRETEDKVIALEAGCDDFISKPFDRLELLARVKSLLRIKSLYDKIEELALYDSLTGLPNRRFFLDKLEDGISNAARYGRRLGLLYIDLDDFKSVNDTMGHDSGDELLVKVGAELKKTLRKADTLARIGGDEFGVILFEIKEMEDTRLIGDKIIKTLCQPFQLGAGIAQIGASVGAAIFPDHQDTVDTLIKQADTSMYKAKASGKNTCVMSSNEEKNPSDSLLIRDDQELAHGFFKSEH